MNYIDFFGLNEYPFSMAVDNRFYYNSDQHSDALIRLKYAVKARKGLAVLVGGIGTGKTTLARRMLDELEEEENCESALLVIIHTQITSEWFLRKITMQLGIDEPEKEKTRLLTQLYNRLIELYDMGKKVIVLIDEAQMLQNKEVMEDFRGLLNIEMENNKLITFIFFGLPELDTYLALDEPLRQRVAIRYGIKSFTKDAITEDYIKYRLGIAGCSRELFTADALSAIHKYSEGIPRLINILCDNALLEGFLRKKETIDDELIKELASDLKIAGKEI
ncbi:MAG: ExeA family protein [Nitrospirota bacterium]